MVRTQALRPTLPDVSAVRRCLAQCPLSSLTGGGDQRRFVESPAESGEGRIGNFRQLTAPQGVGHWQSVATIRQPRCKGSQCRRHCHPSTLVA